MTETPTTLADALWYGIGMVALALAGALGILWRAYLERGEKLSASETSRITDERRCSEEKTALQKEHATKIDSLRKECAVETAELHERHAADLKEVVEQAKVEFRASAEANEKVARAMARLRSLP